MNEENNPGAEMEIIESELELGRQRIIKDNISIKKINLVTVTVAVSKDDDIDNEISIIRQDNQLLNNLELPMGSFLSTDSEQSS